MSNEMIFLEPIFKERIWGGTRLADAFGYMLPSNKIGESWAISAHPHGDCVIKNGEYAGETLSVLFDSHPELFGNTLDEEFPLLVKILDSEADLSVQVHPDDVYAHEHEAGSLGKRECWYVIDCASDASIVVGQKTSSKEELAEAIVDGDWDDVLIEVPIKPGDFFQIEPGCVHALKAGALILETQQSSDITYRLYDYDRVDDAGNKRELHIEKALDVIDYTIHEPNRGDLSADKSTSGHFILEKNESYTVHLLDCNADEMKVAIAAPYICGTVISGSGLVNGHAVSKGQSFIVLKNPKDLLVSGNLKLICSHI